MNEMIIKGIANDLGITEKQVSTVLSLLEEGNMRRVILFLLLQDIEKKLQEHLMKNLFVRLMRFMNIKLIYLNVKKML